MKYSLCIFLGLLTIQRTVAQPATEQEIMNLEKSRFIAMLHKDSAALSKILDPDLVYTHSNGAADSKSSFINSIMKGTLEYYAIEIKNIKATVAGEVAWITGTLQMNVKAFGNITPDLSINYLDIYSRHNGRWQMVAWHSARLNPPPK